MDYYSNSHTSGSSSAGSTLQLLKKSSLCEKSPISYDKEMRNQTKNGFNDKMEDAAVICYQNIPKSQIDAKEITMLLKKDGDGKFLEKYFSQANLLSDACKENEPVHAVKPCKTILKKPRLFKEDSVPGFNGGRTFGSFDSCSSEGQPKSPDSVCRKYKKYTVQDQSVPQTSNKSKENSKCRLSGLARKTLLTGCFRRDTSCQQEIAEEMITKAHIAGTVNQ